MDQRMSKEQTGIKYIGTAIPIPLYKKLRIEAVKEDLSLSGLLRTALISHLERDRRKDPKSAS